MSELLGGLQDRTFAQATAATAISYPLERRLRAAQLASYLDRRNFAVVGTTRRNGRPHAAMSVYIRRGVTFWLPTMAGPVRERNLRGTPWLTMVIAEADHPEHIAVIIEGPEVWERWEGAAATPNWVSAWIRLSAERLLSYAGPNAQP